jgi:hypothetical protein
MPWPRFTPPDLHASRCARSRASSPSNVRELNQPRWRALASARLRSVRRAQAPIFWSVPHPGRPSARARPRVVRTLAVTGAALARGPWLAQLPRSTSEKAPPARLDHHARRRPEAHRGVRPFRWWPSAHACWSRSTAVIVQRGRSTGGGSASRHESKLCR